MKIKTLLIIVFAFTCFTSFGQSTKGVLFKSDKWADIKGNGDVVKAWENPINEKVEILTTDSSIKATFGKKVYNYEIISLNKPSDVVMQYTVKLNEVTYTLTTANMLDGTYTLGITDIWQVIVKNRDITAVGIK